MGNATLTAANSITGDAGSTAASDAALALTSTNGSIAIGSARAGGDMALSAVNGSIGTSGIIAAGDDMRITAASMALGRIEATGSGTDSEADGANIVLTSTGAATVVHAEATGNFTANVGSFATGLNSIVTGGDIVVASPGTVDLGNSSAGGFVSVNGQSIAFNTVSAGSFVSLTAEGTGAADGVFGTDITAGGTVAIDGPGIAVGGTIQSDGTLRATASTGGVAIGLADTAGNIIVSAGTDLSGIYRAGGNVELTAGGNVTAEADAAGGYADPSGNSLSEGYVFVDAGGDAALTDSSAATMIGIRTGGAASLTGGTAGEDVFVLAGTTATLANVTAGDDLTVQAGGAIDATDAATTGTGPDGRSVVYAGGGSVPVPFLQIATTPADLSNVMLTAGTDIAAVRVGAFDNLIADAGGTVTGSVIAGGNLTLVADGSIAIDSAETGDDGAVTLSAGTGIDADEIYSRGVTTLTTDDGAVRVGNLNSRDAVSVSADSLDIGTNGPITFANIVTDVGDAAIRSGNRFIVENATIAGTARFDNSGEHMIIEALTADAAQFNAAEMISMAGVGVTDGLAASAGTTILVDGAVTGRDMTLASRDITIAPSGHLGTLGITRTLSLANNDDGRQSFVGGTGTVTGYHIDADEMTRLHAAAIEIIAPMVAGGGAEPDLVIDGFTMTGGASSNANLGTDGSLTLRTPGRARVIGAVALTDLADTNSLTVAADTALEVILGQGSVRLSNGSDPAGRLNLAAGAVFVATQAAIGDIAGAASIDAIDARLAENDGVTSDEGALFAGGINAAVGDGFYVQNSGAGTQTAQRRGLTFGALGLNVDASAPTARIVVNGVAAGASGPVTGLDTIPLLTVNGAAPASGSFDRRSTLNGCLILNTGACLPAQPGGVEMNFPVQDVIEEEASADSDEGEGSTLPTPLITMRELDPMTGEPLLDDPVTGAGNDDLWTSPGS